MRTLIYSKPELVMRADARAAIQGGTDNPVNHKDGMAGEFNKDENPAYEADE